MLKLHAKALKATVVLDAAALVGLVVPNGKPKFPVVVEAAGLNGRVLKAELNAKSLRRCVTAIQTAGPESVAVVLSGRLEGDTLAEAGMVVQPKTPKPQPE